MQPTGVFGLEVHTVHIQSLLTLLREIQRVGSLQLHAGSQLITGNLGVESRLSGTIPFMNPIKSLQKIPTNPLELKN